MVYDINHIINRMLLQTASNCNNKRVSFNLGIKFPPHISVKDDNEKHTAHL